VVETGEPNQGRVFVSHAGHDRAWAEWVAAQLRAAGFHVEVDISDWSAGEDFLQNMSDALEGCDLMVALWSSAYFKPESYALRELKMASTMKRRVIPLRLESTDPPPLWAHLIYHDLFGVPEDAATRVLLEAIAGPAGPGQRAVFPSQDGMPRLPGTLPPLWNVPARSALFTGRDDLIVRLRAQLQHEKRFVVSALHGLGGVGKTMLAVEYAHRFAGDYRLVWWVNAEEPTLIEQQLAELAVRAGLTPAEADTPTALAALHAFLHTHGGWLIVFDNATNPVDVSPLLPQGPGDVLVTSRSAGWDAIGHTVSIGVFSRHESLAMLGAALPALTTVDAERLAERLGDLPLAVAQAVGVMRETAMPAEDFLDALGEAAATVLSAGTPVGYPLPLAASVQVALDRLDGEDVAAGQLARLCALLGPEPIPLWLFTGAPPGTLPAPLGDTARQAFLLRQSVARLARFGLAQLDEQTLTMHRLTQAVLADRQAADARALVDQLLVAARPESASNPASWGRWSQLMPHVLAAHPATTTNDDLRSLAAEAVWHLQARGEARAALPLVEGLYESWKARYGPDEYHTLSAAMGLATTVKALGQYERAYRLNEESLRRWRTVFGEDHPDTLRSANNLAADLRRLGRSQAAYDLDLDTLTRRRALLGEGHQDTLYSANGLAADLRRLGRNQEAHELDLDTISRRRALYGDDHADTLWSANGLAEDLRRLDRYEEAYQIDRDTLARRRALLGDDHPDTHWSANCLAADLRGLGRYEEAYELAKDTLERRRASLGDNHPDTRRLARTVAEDLRRIERRAVEQQEHARRTKIQDA
jgi:hypothetical protein